jgi:chitodextrinase
VWGNPTDVVSPVISNLQVSSITTSSVVISWSTDEVSNSNVLYSTDSSYENVKSDTGYSRNHSIVLAGLNAGTQYNFKVRSSDASGNSSESTEDTFTTSSRRHRTLN